MYTVVIAEKEHIDNFEEYAMYLKPFIKKSQFALCQWKPEEEGGLYDLVPELEKLVDRRKEWRALIICDERGLEKRNPFNVIEYREPERDMEAGETLESWFERRKNAKEAACREAAKEPLVRLMTSLCEDPVVTRKGEELLAAETENATENLTEGSEKLAREYLEAGEYRWLTKLKKELRDEIRSVEPRQFEAPSEVICIAKRHNELMDNELESVWGNRDEREYSRFYDWNLYFDQMRYLVFDIEARNSLNYRSDYIRFLTSVCLIADHAEAIDCIQANRVYRVCSEVNQKNLALMLERYFAKLEATKSVIQDEAEEIRQTELEELEDYEVKSLFCDDVDIPVNLDKKWNRDELFFKQHTGLASDCPKRNEEIIWLGSYGRNRRALKALMKEFPRALKRSVGTMRKLFVKEGNRAVQMTDDQRDDVQEHIDSEEMAMVETLTNSEHDLQHYYQRMEASERRVHAEIDRRMNTLPTVLFGVFALLAVVVGVIPTFLMNDSTADRLLLVRLAGSAVCCVAVAGFACLLVHWTYMRRQFDNYNTTMSYILSEIESDADQYSLYLSHACNFMRSTSALALYDEHSHSDFHKIRVLQKHIQDIDRQRAETQDIFGEFLHYEGALPEFDEAPYDYDFSRATDYAYPIQPMPDLTERIIFLQKGSTVDIPYGTIRELTLGREELYD